MHDVTNARFGRLVALGPAIKNGRRAWQLRCDCGSGTIVETKQLIAGRVRSCGCYRGKRID